VVGGKPGVGAAAGTRTGPAGTARPAGAGVGKGRPAGLAGTNGLGVARPGAVAANRSTANVSRQAMANRANTVRNNFNHYDSFNRGWWASHPGAWRAARWTAAAAVVWGAASWGSCADYCGYPAEPTYYDYGSNVVYEGTNVYVDGDAVATQDQYAQQAAAIATTGKQAEATMEEEWLPLGVFAMIQGDQVYGNDLFQLAVNKAGTIRGNYYNVLSDTTLPVYGSVDKKTQRAAWTIGERKDTVYEAGIANLTKPETTMLVHFGKDNTQQWTLVRVEQPAEKK
jgi:hypothetical protein